MIVRIKGGLGNQLFCYSAARRLALVNDAELVIDDVTGFARDSLYGRRYMLDFFKISARKATPKERLEPFERFRRGIFKWLSRMKPFAERLYLEQEGRKFDPRLLCFKVKGTLYIDGLWQSEGYFKDVRDVILDDLRIVSPSDIQNLEMVEKIKRCNAVAIHVRWFDVADSMGGHNVSTDFYGRAIVLMEKKLKFPHYFIFSDNIEAARAKLSLPVGRAIFITHNRGEENAYADLWLMTHCQHFIIANSTFSWWGAWLGGTKEKMVFCPKMKIDNPLRITSWDFPGQLPDIWMKI